MSDAARPDAPAPQEPPRGLWSRFWTRRFRKHTPHEHHEFIWLARYYDAQFYALIIAFGVPLMGWTIGDVTVPFTSIVLSSYDIKLTIAALWFAGTHVYWGLELDEIRAQIKEHGLLDVEGSDYQRSTMQSLYYGVVFAAVVWIIGIVVYVVTWLVTPTAVWIGPSYGIVELAILVHTGLVGKFSIKVVYPLISIIQQALAGQLRRETVARD